MKCKWCGAEVISIHAPLTGSDGGGNTWLEKRTRFQSTLPSQGATPYMEAGLVMQMISIHAPLTGSDPPVCAIWERLLISIHAPLTGSDSGGHNGHYGRVDFNPRSPHRERQICASVFTPEVVISIHAPLTGSDDGKTGGTAAVGEFQSTLPSQGATTPTVFWNTVEIFQSTLPSQGATANIHIKFLCDLLFSTLSSKISLLFRVFHR